MIEIIQGEGGIRQADDAFIKFIRETTEKKDILLIIDEVQSGMARTGKWFSYQHYNINPDIVTCAKGLGNGVPIGACLGNKKVSHFLRLAHMEVHLVVTHLFVLYHQQL